MRRIMAFLAVLVLSIGVVCNVAYAEGSGGGGFGDEVIYGPSVYNVAGQTYCVQVYAGNNLNAALTALGYDAYDARFTSDVKAYLSDSTYGGSFYQFAQQFTNNNEPNWGVTIYSISYTSALGINNGLYGAEYVFGASYTQQLYDDARQRVEDILDGNVGSGGGGSGTATNWKTFYCTQYSNTYNLTSVDNVVYSASVAKPNDVEEMPQYVTLSLSGGDLPSFTVDDKCYIYTSFNSSILDVTFTTFDKSMTVESASDAKGNEFNVKYKNNSGGNVIQTRTMYRYNITGFDDGVLSCTYVNTSTSTQRLYNGNTSTISIASPQPYFIYGDYGSGGGNPTVPPTNWPDPPNDPTPTPPDVPEPDPPVTPDPPTNPTPPSNPVFPIQPTYNTSIFTVDLQGILDALDEHCQHLQNALYTDLKNFYDNLTSKMTNDFSTLRTFLNGQVSWLGETITDSMDALQDYLYDLFHWLADELDFTVTGGDYNDSTVISWLKKIYYKLGGGTNTKPIDPVSDPFDFGQWLYELWQNFVLDLLALGRNGLAEVAYSLGELIHKFPFSIPWDIAAMLGLLVAEPVTPVIEFPMFYYTGSSVQTVQTRVDLSPYNNYVEPVRVMIKIGFAFVLAWRTKDMMELLTMARGGNSA